MEGNALAGADCPDTALSFRVGQYRDGIGGAAQFVGVDWLEVFQFEMDFWKVRAELQPNEWGAKDGGGNPFPGGTDFFEADLPDGWQRHRMINSLAR